MESTRARRIDPAGVIISSLLLAGAAVMLWDTSRLTITSTYGVGPKMMPIVVASGMALLAVANLFMTWRGELPASAGMDPKAVLFILGGLVALIAVIGFGIGFIPAIAILFATTAAAFGRRALLADLAIGLSLGFAVYLLFAKLLTLSLPMGPIERLL
jgi:putative tricarboxylic transport membrane protein